MSLWLGWWAYGWWYRFRFRQMARMIATRHMAIIAKAMITGSTDAYTLLQDLPRQPQSTEIDWDYCVPLFVVPRVGGSTDSS